MMRVLHPFAAAQKHCNESFQVSFFSSDVVIAFLPVSLPKWNICQRVTIQKDLLVIRHIIFFSLQSVFELFFRRIVCLTFL